jgi:hypothetical protein
MTSKMTSKFSRAAHGKHLFAASFVTALAFYAAPASAACVSSSSVYCDTTKIQAFNGNSPNNYGGPGFVPPGQGDVLQDPGHSFDTDRMVVSLTKNSGITTLDMKFYTTFNGNDQTARYADIFLGNNTSTLTSQNSFGYAISVGDQAANGGLNSVGFYNVSALGAEKTSEQIWQSKTSFIYGGEFLGTDGLLHDAPTVVTTTASAVSNFTASVTETSSGDASFPYLVDVKLSALNTDFNALFSGGLSAFWGTGDCSNDAILAVIPYAPRQVPEPLTLSLFSAGVIGIGAMRRRRKAKAA